VRVRDMPFRQGTGTPFSIFALSLAICPAALAANSFAAARQAPISLTEGPDRPANLYRSVFQRDKTACTLILQSLNMKYALSAEELADNYNDLNGYTDLLLASYLAVHWERKLLWDENLNIPTDTLDYALVDLTNDGQKRGLYRWSYSRGGYDSVNELFVSDTPLAGFETAKHLTRAAVRELSADKIEINGTTAPQLPWRNLAGGFMLFNVVVVNTKTFMLAVDAGQVTQSYLKGGNRSLTEGSRVDLYVLRFESLAQIGQVCQFRVR
jgi:hypothetical protein